jgi:hypothetical protein
MGSSVMIYIYIKFHKDWLRHSNVDKVGAHRHTHIQTHREQGDLVNRLLFSFQNKESGLKIQIVHEEEKLKNHMQRLPADNPTTQAVEHGYRDKKTWEAQKEMKGPIVCFVSERRIWYPAL